jgi:hypothetical protein
MAPAALWRILGAIIGVDRNRHVPPPALLIWRFGLNWHFEPDLAFRPGQPPT